MDTSTLETKIRRLRRNIARTNMPRSRSFNKEFECFLEGVDLEEKLKEGFKALELGCGEGNTLRYMQERFRIVPYGIDLSFYGRFSDLWTIISGFGKGIRYRKGDVESLPFKEGEFDFVFAYRSLIYVPDKLKAIKESHRVLKVNGTAVLEIDAYTDKNNRFFPNAEEIIAGTQDSGQIDISDVTVWDGKLGFYAQQVHTVTRVIINKKNDRCLQFPELTDFRVERSRDGIRGVTSFYEVSQSNIKL